MKVHEVKTLPIYFWPQVVGLKNFEIRKKDREYQEGDILKQREWDPTKGEYTGAVIEREITYILDDPNYCKEGFAVLGLRKMEERK